MNEPEVYADLKPGDLKWDEGHSPSRVRGMGPLKFIQGFRFAWSGLKHAVASELNMRVHLASSAAVGLAGLYFGLSQWEWIALIFAMALVIAGEAVNTAVERLADSITQQENDLIRYAKDTSAAAVLVLAIAAAAVGAIVFIPHVINLFGVAG